LKASVRTLALATWLVGQAWAGEPGRASPIWSGDPKGHGLTIKALNWQTLKPLSAFAKPSNWQPVAFKLGSIEDFPNPFWSRQLNGEPSAKPALAWSAVAAADVVDSAGLPVNPPKPAPLPLAAVQDRLAQLPNQPSDYVPLIRLGQLPTATLWNDANFQISTQQVSPAGGGDASGSGNQNYALRGDLQLTEKLLVSAYYTYADDPLYNAPASKSSNPGNLWTVYGAALKGRLAGGKAWQWAAEGALELFSVGSGCGGQGNSCTGGNTGQPNIFNDSLQQVFTRNVVGSLSLPLSWQATRQLQLSFVPAVSWLPSSQGASQGGAGEFFGTNISLGVGANYRPSAQLQLFGSAMVPLGPGNNSFDSNLVYSRTPILSLGATVAINPRIGLEASITNGFGLSPSTAILALPSAPWQPMLSGRFTWTPSAPDSKNPNYTRRQASLALGGLSVNTALTPASGTKQLAVNADSRGNIFGFAGVSVSNDFQFQVAGGQFNGISPQNNFVSTYEGAGNTNIRFGGKAMVMRPTKHLPIWSGGRISLGRNYQPSSYQGYLFFESMNTWEATPWLAFTLNPKVAISGLGTPWGVGIGANIQLGPSFQLIPEINAVATDLGGTNGTNGSLNLRWLANAKTTVDLYVTNAAGLLDMGQLLGNNQVRVGTKLMLSF
jgi:hypothetical protein